MGKLQETARDRTTAVYITCPNLHWVHKTVAVCLMGILQDTRYSCRIDMPSAKPFENNLNQIVQRFLASDCQFWLTIDDDNPPTKNPLDLIELDLDIVGLPTPVWHYERKAGERPIYFNAYEYDPTSLAYREFRPQEGLKEVDAVGTGCVLMHRRVFENSNMQAGAFLRTWTASGIVERGNDISFCERAKHAGFKVWAHFDYPCDHMTEVSLLEVIRSINGLSDG